MMNVLKEVFITAIERLGIPGLLIISFLIVLWITTRSKAFKTLSQKKRYAFFKFIPYIIFIAGIFVVIFFKQSSNLFGGMIVDENDKALPGAFVYIVLFDSRDTLHADLSDSEGNFKIPIDREGIKGFLHYGHPNYETERLFRVFDFSTNVHFPLKKRKSAVLPQKTFSINFTDEIIISEIERETKLKYKFSNASYTITIGYDKSKLDSFDNRYRYLGGKILVSINNNICCESTKSIKETSSIGSSLNVVEQQLDVKTKDIIMQEKNQLIKKISACLNHS